MTHDDALAFLNARLNYELRGMPEQTDLRVDRTAMLLERLGRPQDQFPIVHIAGTKGKGSTSSLTAALLQESGLSVGLHTSPHLQSVHERFQVDRQKVSPRTFARLISEMLPAIHDVDSHLPDGQPKLTFFEITTALALLHFANSAVQIAVIEVGMGGRLDSTNVVDPTVCIITNISLDHTRQLGDTHRQIAREKAGIIKPHKPVITAVAQPDALDEIRQRCNAVHATLRILHRDFGYAAKPLGLTGIQFAPWTWRRRWPDLHLAAIGPHQAENAALAVAAIDACAEAGVPFQTTPTGKSLASLAIPGRFEILAWNPLLVLDVAHNPASFLALRRTVDSILPDDHRGRRILVFSASRDKDWRGMLDVVHDRFDTIILTQYTSNPRTITPEEIASQWNPSSCPNIISTSDPEAAIRAAFAQVGSSKTAPQSTTPKKLDANHDLICIAGSFYLVAEARDLLTQPQTAHVPCETV